VAQFGGRLPDVRAVPAELLAKRDRDGVLEVRAASLEHTGERFGLAVERARERAGCLEQSRQRQQDRETRRRREDVVCRLAHVDVVVRVDARVLAQGRTQDLGGAVGEHLVRVHVVRRAGARLVDVHDELVAQPAGEDLVSRLDDRGGDVAVQPPQSGVGAGARLLDEHGRGHQLRWCRQPADGEILNSAPGLDAVVGACRDPYFAQRVALETGAGFPPGIRAHEYP
jgi:hypothetical protein